MTAPKIEVSLAEEMENVANALQRVTSAIFAGAPGSARTIRRSRKAAQFTFRLNDSKQKQNIQSGMRQKIINDVFKRQATRLEKEIKQALKNVVLGLIGIGSPGIKVMGRSLGSAKASRPIDSQPFAQYIKSPAGAGEIGLPDPNESIRNLKIALFAAISIDVVVRSDGPRVKFEFDQGKLLKLTPHPDTMEGGARGAFHSWLSLVTGPDMVNRIAGFSLVRASDIRAEMQSVAQKLERSNLKNRRTFKPLKALEGLLKISRTRGNAGDYAGLMLRNRRNGRKRSTAEFAGGENQDYSPTRRFDGFWDEWWLSVKADLGTWTRRIMFAAVRGSLKR